MELDFRPLRSVLPNENDSQLVGASHRVGATVDAELCHHPLQMARYSLGTDHEPRGDRFRVAPVGEQSQHLDFTSRQRKLVLVQRGLLLGGADSIETAANARHQLVRVERLDDVVVGAKQ